jgi:hypothetical protein
MVDLLNAGNRRFLLTLDDQSIRLVGYRYSRATGMIVRNRSVQIQRELRDALEDLARAGLLEKLDQAGNQYKLVPRRIPSPERPDSCPICMEDIGPRQQLKRCQQCKRSWCTSCHSGINRQNRCPFCRSQPLRVQ